MHQTHTNCLVIFYNICFATAPHFAYGKSFITVHQLRFVDQFLSALSALEWLCEPSELMQTPVS